MSNLEHKKNQRPSRDYLWLNLRELPYFRALLRAVEACFYADIELPSPTLDLGCGDGHFAGTTFEQPLDTGIDPGWESLQEARDRGAYHGLVQADGARLPFPGGYFASAVSNSVLEHIPQVEQVVLEAARVLKPGAIFVFCVPNQNFLPSLSLGRAFDRIGLRVLGNAYRAFFNRISRHYHCDPPQMWLSRLENSGFRVVKWWHYFSPAALSMLEWGHFFGLPSWICKTLTGHWILSPTRWNLALTTRLVQRFYARPEGQADGAYTFYVAVRI